MGKNRNKKATVEEITLDELNQENLEELEEKSEKEEVKEAMNKVKNHYAKKIVKILLSVGALVGVGTGGFVLGKYMNSKATEDSDEEDVFDEFNHVCDDWEKEVAESQADAD